MIPFKKTYFEKLSIMPFLWACIRWTSSPSLE